MSNAVKTKAIVTLDGWDCDVNTSEFYRHNRRQRVMRLTLADTENNRAKGMTFPGEPFATASLCIPGFPFHQNETAIKNYSENKGILETLLDAGVIEKTDQQALVNLMPVPVVRILI